MKNSIEKSVLQLTEPTANDLGIYIVDISFAKENGKRILRIFIDKDGGVGIDDCEKFSRAIDPILDEADPIEEAYSLEVSSPGADRKLETERELLYYTGRQVYVKLYKAVNGHKEFTGELCGFSDGIVKINLGAEAAEFKKSEAVYIRLHFEF